MNKTTINLLIDIDTMSISMCRVRNLNFQNGLNIEIL